MGMKISILYLGKMEFPKFRLVDWKDEGAMVQSPAGPSTRQPMSFLTT